MRKLIEPIAVGVLALCSIHAVADAQVIVGKKLLIKDPLDSSRNKVMFLSKDASITIPSGVVEDPRCAPEGSGVAAILLVSDGMGRGNFIFLDCANWSFNGTNVYKYKDPSGATCKSIKIKNGALLRGVCKGPQVNYQFLGEAQGAIRVTLLFGNGAKEYCTSFSEARCDVKKDGSDDKTYLAKNCTSAPSGCYPASPNGAFIDGAANF